MGCDNFEGKGCPIVKYRMRLSVQKQLNRSICHLGSGLGWAEGNVSSVVLARWRQGAQFHSYSSGGANVPDDTLPCVVHAQLNRLICHLCYELGWAEGITSSIVFAKWHGKAHWRHLENTIELVLP